MKRKISESEYRHLTEAYGGICMACGATRYQVEPDAAGYTCEACGKHEVMGAEQALLEGRITLGEP